MAGDNVVSMTEESSDKQQQENAAEQGGKRADAGPNRTMPSISGEVIDEKAKFPIPNWASRPPSGGHLDVSKGDQLIRKLLIDEKKAYYFGRNPQQVDFLCEHASCSRVHAVLVYHGILSRFALVDMESSHGTFIGDVRIEPLKVVFIDDGSVFRFGASSRKYTLRIKLSSSADMEDSSDRMPDEIELENKTELNTAYNRRIPALPISLEEARRKKRPRGNVAFIEEEEIINPEDVDPSIGRFRNLVTTAVISSNSKKRNTISTGKEPPKKIIRPGRDNFIAPMSSTLGGVALNAAPDLDLYGRTLPEPGQHHTIHATAHYQAAQEEDETVHKKKYVKESWPGRKPGTDFADMEVEEGQIETSISLEEAQKFLRGKDAIMEYNVNEMLEAYLEKGGNTEDAIELIANGYVATAQVANVMCDWLKTLGDDPKPAGARRKRKEKKREKQEDGKGEQQELSLEIYNGKEEAIRCVENSLATMIKKYFNADMADRIFEDGGIGIDWLPALISHRRWRSILYSLIEEHRDCLMLTFAVKLISDAGFQNEISNVSTAAQQLDIYSRVFLTTMSELLKQVKKGVDSASYNQAFEEVARVICLSEHTYTYAISILKELSRTEKGWIKGTCEAISDQLRKYIPERIYDTTSLRTAIACTAQDQMSTQVYQAILAMITKGELNPADVNIVFEAYILPRPPPIEIIRDAVFENMLIDSLFHCDGPRVAPEHRDKYVYLLAYSASVSETTTKNGTRQQLRFELDPCRSSIEKAAGTLEATDDILCELKDLMYYSRTAVAAAGILYYVQTLLLSESRLGDPPPVALVLLDHIVSLHPNLHTQAFDICCQLYDRISEESEAAEVGLSLIV
ncbi:hypothetical protein WR25_22721 isoform B [Diploscapter pachys]|uniref:FHA domain-containing protein n=1 Tax=Diploscapter pachys TaxID=2018661 RepID=A0A2A2KUX6_9BILA|nr:hypothetical protein WR25_22721 isoform B [Diploscapter pachys]